MSSSPATVLIIDDLASVRLYHVSFLRRKGYRCLEAMDGRGALEILAGQTINLILLDLVMPGMDGEAFIEHLDRDPAAANLPVLVITSEQELAAGLVSRARRPIAVVTKPVMPDALLRAAQQLLATECRAPVGAGHAE